MGLTTAIVLTTIGLTAYVIVHVVWMMARARGNNPTDHQEY